jgi:hypothetical protein
MAILAADSMRHRRDRKVGSHVPIRQLATLLAARATPKPGSAAHASHRSLVLTVAFAIGALVVILAIPLLLKKVRPNRYYGLVSVLRQESQTRWYAANRFLGASLLIAGLVTIAGTAIVWAAKVGRSSNKLLAGIELVLVVVPPLLAYVVANARYRNL